MSASDPDGFSGLSAASGPSRLSEVALRYWVEVARDLEHNLREQDRVRRQAVPSGMELADLRDSHVFLTNLSQTLESFLASSG
ncbi:hypothetical protein ACFY8B_29080 [Streptomyces sp. NPDC012751]|uniref:hypothetical protein n=1 Tax=Streptomyces sp. NPDC012751 TaxID=3364846 RepID=UPI00368A1EB2